MAKSIDEHIAGIVRNAISDEMTEDSGLIYELLRQAVSSEFDSRGVGQALERQHTPADYRAAKNYTVAELQDRLEEYGLVVTGELLRRYEGGRINNVDHSRIATRMRVIADVLGVAYEDYRDSVIREMERLKRVRNKRKGKS